MVSCYLVLSDHLDEHGDSVKQELPGCYVGQRKITKIQLYIECYQVIDAAEKDLVWLFIRKDLSSVGQIVPGLGGFASVTRSRPMQLTILLLTVHSTSQECFCVTEEALREVG